VGISLTVCGITGSLVIEQAFAVPGNTTAVGVLVYHVLLIGVANLIVKRVW
jgi:hypothetical protein